MILTIQRRQTISRLSLGFGLLVSAFIASTGTAHAQLNPYKEDYSRAAIDARRAEREQAREELAARHEGGYLLDLPLVSEQTIAATRAAIMKFEQIEAAGEWGVIPEGSTITLGDYSEHVSALRRRFEMIGDLPPSDGSYSDPFDQAMQEAIAQYQVRNGLPVTGFVDQPTLRTLNVPVSVRLNQLRMNLARLEKLAAETKAGRYVIVNIPAYMLQAVDHGRLAVRSRVVVGEPSRATPEVSAKIIELNFYPTWRVPKSIAQADLIPKLQIDPTYLARERFSVSPSWGGKPLDPAKVDWSSPKAANYKFRQDPGPWNALGVVRINMPNKHIVYLHDTPHKNLFDATARAFSSGCVRVQEIGELAAWLASGAKGWDAYKVAEAMRAWKTKSVKIPTVPVHFVYVTAWATPDGFVHFRPDIYGKDGTGDEGEIEQIAGAEALTP